LNGGQLANNNFVQLAIANVGDPYTGISVAFHFDFVLPGKKTIETFHSFFKTRDTHTQYVPYMSKSSCIGHIPLYSGAYILCRNCNNNTFKP
jgi:hypothetical protein